MTITNKIVYVKSKDTFKSLVNTIPDGLNPIVFIEDSKELWTCGTYFSIGYPSLVVSESGSIVTVTLGDSDFTISTSGSGLSVRKGTGNQIIFNSSSLTSIDAISPLEWKDNKLIHKDSGVTAGSYGSSSTLTNASTFYIPNIVVDTKGHITKASDTTVTIRDYVEQVAQSDKAEDHSILTSYNALNQIDEVSQVRKANGLTYNDGTKKLTVSGGIISNSNIEVTNGDLLVDKGYIIGNLKGDITGQAIPKIHLSAKPEYGGASKGLYGHVLLQDDLPTSIPNASSDNTTTTNTEIVAIAASPRMVWNLKEYVDSKGINVTGYNSNGDKMDLSSSFVFSKDFQTDNSNVQISWIEI
jgi:hypothetical protein